MNADDDFVDLKSEFEIETFKIVVNFLQDDLNETLKKIEVKASHQRDPHKNTQFNSALVSQRIEIFKYFLKRMKQDHKGLDERSLEILFDCDDNCTDSIKNVFALLFKVFMKTMSIGDRLNNRDKAKQSTLSYNQNVEATSTQSSSFQIDYNKQSSNFVTTTTTTTDDENSQADFKYDDPIDTQTLTLTNNYDASENILMEDNLCSTENDADTSQQQLNQGQLLAEANAFKFANQNQESTSQITSLNSFNSQSLYSFTRTPFSNLETSKLKKRAFRRMYYCHLCPFHHAGLTYLNQHLIKHRYQEGALRCQYCEFYETSRIKLDNHVKSHLTDNKHTKQNKKRTKSTIKIDSLQQT
jgi:hypothetical protein